MTRLLAARLKKIRNRGVRENRKIDSNIRVIENLRSPASGNYI
jgi:hypothetical protein